MDENGVDELRERAGDNVFADQFGDQGRMRILDGMRYYKKTDVQNNVPRCIVRLKENVDAACLQHAAEAALARHRTFRLTVARDDKRFYLVTNDQKPVVQRDDGNRHVVGNAENNGYLTRIGYKGDTISVEFFHGTSDGMGVMAFLKTLLYGYCCEKYGEIGPAPAGTLLKGMPEDPREYADSMLFLPEEPAVSDAKYEYERAFQLPDMQMDHECACKYFELRVDAAAFEEYMRRNGASRSAVFAWMMNRVIAQVNHEPKEPIVAALAVNARKAYGAEKTEQCCVSTVPLWYDHELSALPVPEQLRRTRQMIVDGTQPNNIIAGAQRTKKFNEMLEARFATLEEKQVFARTVNKQGGIKYTYGISYIGETKFSDGIDAHISECYLMLCANTIPVIMEIAKCGDHYHISYCTHLVEDPYVNLLKDSFEAKGIPCICIQKEDFIETLVVF